MTDRFQLDQFLLKLAEALDISETHFQEAKDRYEAVGDWLRRDGSDSLASFEPDIYPQGSFRLGTVTKPIDDADEYDIDLVCELKNLSKSEITQKQLKQMVGNRLKANETYKRMLNKEEGRRCWTLNYADGAHFHMDILPSIPENDIFKSRLMRHGVPSHLTSLAISLTDKTLPNFDLIDSAWPQSNPRGYAEWFKSRMRVRFEAIRKAMAESLRASMEDVPEYRIKTPLQRVVQILKRHRDIMFQEDTDDKPISIIITTLAAHAYNNEADLLDALINVVDGMPRYILIVNGVTWIANPVNPLENFADKWQEHPQREQKFRGWLRQVRADLTRILKEEDINTVGDILKPKFGARAVNEALSKTEKMVIGAAPFIARQPSRIEITSPNKPWKRHD